VCYTIFMSTILKTGRRRCDAVCHTAHGSKCGCICGGKFHGASVTVSKAAERAEIEDIVLTKAMQAAELNLRVVDNSSDQPSLFDDEDLITAYADISKGV
jgi:hypothetical protein